MNHRTQFSVFSISASERMTAHFQNKRIFSRIYVYVLQQPVDRLGN